MRTNEEEVSSIVIENARLIFRNFSGEEGRFNSKGNRNFCVLLEDDLARDLEDDGWNVKYLKPREEGDEPQPYLQVKVRFDNYPPKIVIITSKGKRQLDEDEVKNLDWFIFDKVDVKIRPYTYDINGKKGVAAYLKTMYAILMEDELELKYADVEDSAQSSLFNDIDG
ncbi:MAG TPA: hypothetical protein DCL29_05460 [Eubacterium sp.]|nr:hypothetical protein [Eubacterium sp.]